MLANIDFLMATAVQVTKMLQCLLVWGNCFSNWLLAWPCVSIRASPVLGSNEGGWGAKNISHLRWNSWFPQQGTTWPQPVAGVHHSDYNPYKTNTVSVTPHLTVPLSMCWAWHLVCHRFASAKVVLISIPVLKLSTTTLFLRHACSSSSFELCLIFLSNLFAFRNFRCHRTSYNVVFSVISVGLSSPHPLRERNEKWYSHFSDGEQKHRKT